MADETVPEPEDILDVETANSDLVPLLSTVPVEFSKVLNRYKESEGDCNFFEDGVLGISGISCEGVCVGAYFARYLRSCDDLCIAVLPFKVNAENGLLRKRYEYLGR